MSVLSEYFKEGYCDGHGQAIENVRYNIIEYLKKYKEISIDIVNEICDFCLEIDYEYLNQQNSDFKVMKNGKENCNRF